MTRRPTHDIKSALRAVKSPEGARAASAEALRVLALTATTPEGRAAVAVMQKIMPPVAEEFTRLGFSPRAETADDQVVIIQALTVAAVNLCANIIEVAARVSGGHMSDAMRGEGQAHVAQGVLDAVRRHIEQSVLPDLRKDRGR